MDLPALTWSKGFSGPQNEEKAQRTALRVQNLHSLEAVSAPFWATVRSCSAHSLPAGDPWQIPGDPSLDERDSSFMILYHSSPPPPPPPTPSQVHTSFRPAQGAGVTKMLEALCLTPVNGGFSWTKENFAGWLLGDLVPWWPVFVPPVLCSFSH